MTDLKIINLEKTEKKQNYSSDDIRIALDFQNDIFSFQEKLSFYYKVKVFSEVCFSGLLFVLLSPLFLFISSYLFLRYGSPVYFKQKRVGLNARPFYVYKFRTMKNNSPTVTELGFNPIDKIKNDSRVLGVFGKFLRSFKLDELPQLINVLKGEMLLIGPRPYPYKENYMIERASFARYAIRPGISGPWQIKGDLDLKPDEKLYMDLEYVKKLSFRNDFNIFIKTIFLIVQGGEKSSPTKTTQENEKIRKI